MTDQTSAQLTMVATTLTEVTSQLNTMETKTDCLEQEINKISMLVNVCIAKLDLISSALSTRTTESKRVIKTTATKEATAVKETTDDTASVASSSVQEATVTTVTKKATKSSASKDDDSKIINALNFFKRIVMYKNYDNMRSKYTTEAMIKQAQADVKKPEGTDAYWTAIGNVIWKTLSKDEKKAIKDDFIRWKRENNMLTDSNQLNEDDEHEDE